MCILIDVHTSASSASRAARLLPYPARATIPVGSPGVQLPDSNPAQYQFLLFSILGVILAFATLIMAYLQYRKKYHVVVMQTGESTFASSGVQLETVHQPPREQDSASGSEVRVNVGPGPAEDLERGDEETVVVVE